MNSSSSICVGPCNRKGSEVEKDCHPHTQFRHACQDSSAFVLSLHDGRIDTLKLNPSAVGRPEIRAAIHKSLSFTFLSLSLSLSLSLFHSLSFSFPVFCANLLFFGKRSCGPGNGGRTTLLFNEALRRIAANCLRPSECRLERTKAHLSISVGSIPNPGNQELIHFWKFLAMES